METSREQDDVENLYKFVQNTTLHGVRYTNKRGTSITRRLIWGTVLLASAVTFMYQVVQRTRYYYTYSSNVNVEVVYEQALEFPSVTLCNQNFYRLSTAVESEAYSLIKETYTTYSDLDSSEDNRYPTIPGGYKTFVLEASHQLDNLIHRCMWMGRACNLSADFTTVLTEFGVCYTFTDTGNQVSQAGTTYGLRLVLNIELYEYMAGPHTDAGIRVLLHDPSEYPQVAELGFNVGAATHTLVGIRRSTTDSLPPPYGTCNSSAGPRSTCSLENTLKDVIGICGCAFFYHSKPENGTHCDIRESLFCNYKDEINARNMRGQGGGHDPCGTPCRQVSYKPEISSTMLAPSSAALMWHGRQEELAHARQKYSAAMERKHRVDTDLVNRDVELLNATRAVLVGVTAAAADAVYKLTNTTTGYIGSTMDWIIAETLYSINQHQQNLGQQLTYSGNIFVIEDIIEISYHFGSNLGIKHSSPDGILDELAACVASQTNGTLPSRCTGLLDTHGFINYLDMVLAQVPGWAGNFSLAVSQHLNRTFAGYRGIVPDMIRELENSTCMAIITSKQEEYKAILMEAKQLLVEYEQHVMYNDKMTVTSRIMDLYTQNLSNPYNFYEVNMCRQSNYMRKLIPDSCMQEHVYLLTGIYPTIFAVSVFAEIKKLALDGTDDVIAPLARYLSQYNQSKAELHQDLHSTDYDDLLRLFQMTIGKLDTYKFLENLQSFESYEQNMETLGRKTMSCPLPSLRDADLNTTKLSAHVHWRYSEITEIVGVMTAVEASRFKNSSALETLVQLLVEQVKKTIFTASDELLRLRDELSEWIEEMRDMTEPLKDLDKLVTDIGNYIQLDVYYQEMAYTRIVQQPAFGIGSLLSEVGGFLGLLLGASVLTVCELVDFLSAALMLRWRKNQVVMNQPDSNLNKIFS